MMQGDVNRIYEATIVLVASNTNGTLGDGSEVTFEVYTAAIIWNGQYQNIPVNEAEKDPLIGIDFLCGYNLHVRAVEYGNVTINPIKELNFLR